MRMLRKGCAGLLAMVFAFALIPVGGALASPTVTGPDTVNASGTTTERVVEFPSDVVVVEAPDAPAGSTLHFDTDTNTFTAIDLPDGRRLSVVRGCGETVSACWAGSGAIGDFSFVGSGGLNGTWANRNEFGAGNMQADIGFTRGSKKTYVKNIKAWNYFNPDATVTGFYVYRF